MKFNDYVDAVKEDIRDYLPEEYQNVNINIYKVPKNNGVELTVLILKGNENICPNIYLEPYYEQYKNGMSFEETLSNISNFYQSQVMKMSSFQIGEFSYENVKDNLYVALVNAEKNEKRLTNIPHKIYEDLAAIYRIKVDIEPGQLGSITIHNEHLKLFNMDIETLHEQAMENMKKLMPYTFQNMNEVMAELMGISLEDLSGQAEEENSMWVLSNTKKVEGAAYMIDNDILKAISEQMNSNLIIIPSSIHEILILKEEEDMNIGFIKDMVAEVNSTQVEPEEVLSDSVYHYNKSEQVFSKIEDNCPVQCMDIRM